MLWVVRWSACPPKWGPAARGEAMGVWLAGPVSDQGEGADLGQSWLEGGAAGGWRADPTPYWGRGSDQE